MVAHAMTASTGGNQQPLDLTLVEEVFGPFMGVGGGRFRRTLNISRLGAHLRPSRKAQRCLGCRRQTLNIIPVLLGLGRRLRGPVLGLVMVAATTGSRNMGPGQPGGTLRSLPLASAVTSTWNGNWVSGPMARSIDACGGSGPLPGQHQPLEQQSQSRRGSGTLVCPPDQAAKVQNGSRRVAATRRKVYGRGHRSRALESTIGHTIHVHSL